MVPGKAGNCWASLAPAPFALAGLVGLGLATTCYWLGWLAGSASWLAGWSLGACSICAGWAGWPAAGDGLLLAWLAGSAGWLAGWSPG